MFQQVDNVKPLTVFHVDTTLDMTLKVPRQHPDPFQRIIFCPLMILLNADSEEVTLIHDIGMYVRGDSRQSKTQTRKPIKISLATIRTHCV